MYVSGEGGAEWSSHWVTQRVNDRAITAHVLHDGDVFAIGGIEFRVLHTPGHTPEHVSYLVTDRGSGATEPIGLLSGDFVFVGDLGRPDLLDTAAGGHGTREPGARALYASTQRLAALPEFLQIWPAHGAGSACGKALGAVPSSTLGYERRFNPALRFDDDADAFVASILEGQPEPPLYFAQMKALNRDGPPYLGALPDPPALDGAALAALDARAVAIVDTRPWDAFRAGHLPGALSCPHRASFHADVGSLVRFDEPIHLIVTADARERVIRDLVRIGLDSIVSWTDPDALIDAHATVPEVDVETARALVAEGAVSVLDVRRRTEYDEGHLAGAVNIAHTRLAARLDDVPRDRPLLVHCRSGIRSARASAYLQRAGYDVRNLHGGYLAWVAANAGVTTESAP